MSFEFPQNIVVQGKVWNLIYDPTSRTILPSLQSAKLQSVFGQWVYVPNQSGGNDKYYMSVVDLVFPAINSPSCRKPAQYVRGFSLSPGEVDPTIQPPDGMALYARELDPPANIAQDFLNAVIGRSQETQQQAMPKTDWTRILRSEQTVVAQQVTPQVEVIHSSEQEAVDELK